MTLTASTDVGWCAITSFSRFLPYITKPESLLVHAWLCATLNRQMGMWCSYLMTTRQVDHCKNVCVCARVCERAHLKADCLFFVSSSCSQWSSWNTITPLTQPLTIEDDLLLHTHTHTHTHTQMHANIELFTILFVSQEAHSLIVAFAARKSWITSNTDPPLTCTRPREWRRDSQKCFPLDSQPNTHKHIYMQTPGHVHAHAHTHTHTHTHTYTGLSAVSLHLLTSLLHSVWSAGSSNSEDLQGWFRLLWLFPKTAIYVKMISSLNHVWSILCN